MKAALLSTLLILAGALASPAGAAAPAPADRAVPTA